MALNPLHSRWLGGLLGFLALGAQPAVAVDLATLSDVCLDGGCGTLDVTNPSQQGVASSGTEPSDDFFTSRGNCPGSAKVFSERLFRYSDIWSHEADQAINYSGVPCHVGDIGYNEDQSRIYAPFSNFLPTQGADEWEIARFTTALAFEQAWDLTSEMDCTRCSGGSDDGEECTDDGDCGGGGSCNSCDLAGLAFHDVDTDGDGSIDQRDLYAIEWRPNDTVNPRILKIAISGTTATISQRNEITTHLANGLAFAEPHYIFIANGDDQSEGIIDVYDVSTLENSGVSSPAASLTYDVSTGVTTEIVITHAEGLTLRDKELWVGAAGGDRVREIETPGVYIGCGDTACDGQGDTPVRADRIFQNKCGFTADTLEFTMYTEELGVSGATVGKGAPFKHGSSGSGSCQLQSSTDAIATLDNGAVPNNSFVRVAGMLCQGTRNEIRWKDAEFSQGGSSCSASPDTGFEVLFPENSGAGSFDHGVVIYNDSGSSLQLRNLEVVAEPGLIASLGSVDFSGPTHQVLVGATPETIIAGEWNSYTATTDQAFVGGHLYLRYEISNVSSPSGHEDWDQVIADHPVVVPPPPVPALDGRGLGLLLAVLAAVGVALLQARRRASARLRG